MELWAPLVIQIKREGESSPALLCRLPGPHAGGAPGARAAVGRPASGAARAGPRVGLARPWPSRGAGGGGPGRARGGLGQSRRKHQRGGGSLRRRGVAAPFQPRRGKAAAGRGGAALREANRPRGARRRCGSPRGGGPQRHSGGARPFTAVRRWSNAGGRGIERG